MENNKENSFLEGSVFKSLIRFAIPVLGALILQAAYGAVDLLVVGRFGDAASISAVGTGSGFMQMVTFVITSLAMGATVTIGQHIGEKRPKDAGDAVGTTVVLFVALGVVLTVLLEVFAGNIVAILQVPEVSVAQTITYLRICSGGILIIIAYNVISGILRGVGNANLPFLFVGIACVVNIVGDLVLVGALHMDVAGAPDCLLCKTMQNIRQRTQDDLKCRGADCFAGSDGAGFFSGSEFYHQQHGTDAVSRLWCGTETHIIHYAGAIGCDAECFRFRSTEYRCRTKRQGETGI